MRKRVKKREGGTEKKRDSKIEKAKELEED